MNTGDPSRPTQLGWNDMKLCEAKACWDARFTLAHTHPWREQRDQRATSEFYCQALDSVWFLRRWGDEAIRRGSSVWVWLPLGNLRDTTELHIVVEGGRGRRRADIESILGAFLFGLPLKWSSQRHHETNKTLSEMKIHCVVPQKTIRLFYEN